jgi:hypothetical protein
MIAWVQLGREKIKKTFLVVNLKELVSLRQRAVSKWWPDDVRIQWSGVRAMRNCETVGSR